MKFKSRLLIYLIISLVLSFFIYYFKLSHLNNSSIEYKILVIPYYLIIDFIPKNIYIFIYKYYFIILSIIICIFIFIISIITDILTNEKISTSRGSAHWAEKIDIKDLIKSKGVPIGKFDGKILRVDKTHLVTCAGTRSGKGIGAIIPALLEYPQSLVCLDIKGENYAVTHNRRKTFGKVFVLNPFGLLDIPSNAFNWLDTINLNNENCITKANNLASTLVGRDPVNNIENHFNEQAIRLLQGIILLVCDEKQEFRNMATVSDLIHKVPINELCKLMASKTDLAYGVVSSVGNQFLNNVNERELGSILSTSQRATNFLDNPSIKKTLLKSDFEINRLPDQIMSVYLIIPQDQISDFKAYIRVFFDLAISSITSRKKRGKYEVLFLLDEVAQLGFLEIIPKAISFIKGIGGQLWLFFQSYSQIQNIYGKDADTILSNATQIFYGCNDLNTAKLISETLGQNTIKEYRKDGDYINIPKDLLFHYEIRQLSPEYPIVFMIGKPPIKLKRLNYLKDKEYKNLFSNNPYF